MRRVARVSVGFSFPLLFLTSWASGAAEQDPFSWLNEIKDNRWGERAMQWVQDQNKRTADALEKDPRFERYRQIALQVIAAQNASGDTYGRDPLVGLALHAGRFYHMQRSADHPRGVWQSASIKSYSSGTPQWEDVLDIDALSATENRRWDFMNGTESCLNSRCLIMLMEGASTGNMVTREFDLASRRFVSKGFSVAAGAPIVQVSWKDPDTLIAVGTDGTLLEWSRGQPLSAARRILQSKIDSGLDAPVLLTYARQAGEPAIVACINRPHSAGQAIKTEPTDFWELSRKTPRRLHFPAVAWPQQYFQGQWILLFREDWNSGKTLWKAGSYASVSDAEALRPQPRLQPLAQAGPGTVIVGVSITSEGILLSSYENVRPKMWRITLQNGKWQRALAPLPEFGTIFPWSNPALPGALVVHEDFLHPATVYKVDVAALKAEPIRKTKEEFNGDRYVTEQLWATSRDGVRVPYFLVRPKALAYDGQTPVLMHGYGNVGGGQLPTYDGLLGRLWLEQGGAYVLANIRGGSELGFEWHVTKMERQHVYDDFIAVADDLIRRKITSPRHLGAHGHSMGGQLVGVVINQRPELFNAAVMQNPVLDMIDNAIVIMSRGMRENSALTERARMEYGSLEAPEERAFLERTSAYQNLRRHPQFPVPLVATTTTDTHSPDMSRRYCAKLQSLGAACHFYEYEEGGHGMSASTEQLAHWSALFYTYLAQRLLP